MHKKFIFIIFLIFLQTLSQADAISWHDTITEAFAAAQKQQKYIMIDVYTDWCSWCKELDKRTYTHASVIKLSKTMINVKINPETDTEGKKFLEPFTIDGFPTILFIDWNKNLIGKIGGFLEGEDFAKETTNILAFPEKSKKLSEEHKKGNLKSSEALITLLLEREKQDEAIAIIEELRLKNTLPLKISYYYALGYGYLTNNYYNAALTHFDFIMTRFKPGEVDEEADYYYKSAYYKGLSLSTLGRIEECKKLVEQFKDDENNPYSRYFPGLLEK
ncbi:MAG: thioredoxin family protein [Spirochaetales bacterium]|nr:thioredoxin family protein [Spirochaetales bacterium]